MVRLRVLLVGMALLVLAVAAAAPEADQTQPVTARPSSESTCPITQPVQATPPNDPNTAPFGTGRWYINVDRSMWAIAGQWVGGPKGNKVLWIRPQDTNLTVSAHRLDGDDATPFRADIPCCYPTGFQATKIYFPTPGCWEVTATAGRSALRFVTKVS